MPSGIQLILSRILQLLEESRATTALMPREHFVRALAIWDGVLCEVDMEEWLTLCRGLETGMTPLVNIFVILFEQAQRNAFDFLGSIYLSLGQNFGQAFTPLPVARVLAEVQFSGQLEKVMSIYDPALGSAGLWLAAAEVIEARYPGAIARGQITFTGQDIDQACVLIARINCRLHRIGPLRAKIPAPESFWYLNPKLYQ